MEFKLIIKKLNNALTQEEGKLFDTWYNESPEHKAYFNNVEKNYSRDIGYVDIKKGWEILNKKLHIKVVSRNHTWKYIAVAAVLLILVSIPFLSKQSNEISEQDIQIVNEYITPGTDKATLTLENGDVVELNEGQDFTSKHASSNGKKLIYNENKETSKDIAYNYLTIPRKGQYHVVLSDGTQVWLNSESQLKYPITFVKGEKRNVELLYGEAYFDVSPSSNHGGSKFIVTTKTQDIEVIGTEFNIKAYEDETHIYTTLVEGKINVETNLNKELLNPNQQFVLNKNSNDYVIVNVDTYSEVAWKKGLFSFKNKNLKEIAKVLSRWYDVDFVFVDKNLENVQFKGVLSKNQNIEEILILIQNTNFINAYEINNNTIILKN